MNSLGWDKTIWWPLLLQDQLYHLRDPCGLQPDLKWLFWSPSLCSLPPQMAPEGLHVCLLNRHSRQRLGATSASFTEGTVWPFHLHQGYGVCALRKEKKKTKNNAPQGRSNAQKNVFIVYVRACACVCVYEGVGRWKLSSQRLIGW